MKRVVVIGGGTGTFTLLSGLRHYPLEISVIVSSADDGGSSGILRQQLGVMPPGDIRQCLLGLSQADSAAKQLFAYRFERGELKGHVTGNIILASLEKIFGRVEPAIEVCARILQVQGQIIPMTLRPTTLAAVLKDGRKIVGEHYIDEPNISRKRAAIKTIALSPRLRANPKALQAIARADLIAIGPGDLYTSILPNFLPLGMSAALAKTKAKKVFICSLMTKYGQTDGFKVSDYALELLKYLHGRLDTVVANSQHPAPALLRQYKAEKAAMVETDKFRVQSLGLELVESPLLADRIFNKSLGDRLKRSLLRHDSRKLAKVIYQLI